MLLHFDCWEKDVLVIGSDPYTLKTIVALIQAGAVVTLVAKRETLCSDILAQVGAGEFAWFNRLCLPRDVDGKVLVFNFDDNDSIQQACKTRNITAIDSRSQLKERTLVLPWFHQLSETLSLLLKTAPISLQNDMIHYISRLTLEEIIRLDSKDILDIIHSVEKGDIHQNAILAQRDHTKSESLPRSSSQTTMNYSDNSEHSLTLLSPSSANLAFQSCNNMPGSKMVEPNCSFSASEVVANVAYQFSDMAFLYRAYPGDIENATDKKVNIHGIVPKVVNMVSTATSGASILGAMQSGQYNVSVLLSSAALGHLLPSMFGFARKNLAPVFHVAASKYDENLVLHHSYNDVLNAADSGFTLIASSTLDEAQDMSILSHLLALATSCPVLHFFDGSLLSTQKSPLKLLSNDQILSALKETRDIQGDVLSSFERLSGRLKNFFGKFYQPFEYHGDSNSRIIFVSIGLASKFLFHSWEDLNREGLPVGFLNVRIYRPWSKEALLAILPASVKQIVIIDEANLSVSPLMTEFETSFYSTKLRPILSLASFKEGLENLNPFAVKTFMRSYFTGENRQNIDLIQCLSILDGEKYSTDNDVIESIFWDPLQTGSNLTRNKIFLDHQKYSGSFLQQVYVQHLSTSANPGMVSHIRLGEKMPLKNIHLIHEANVVMCNSIEVSQKNNFAESICKFGHLFINASLSKDELLQIWPECVKKSLLEKGVKVYLLDVSQIAKNFTIFYGNLLDYLPEILASIFYQLSYPKEECSKLIEIQKERLRLECLNSNIFHSQNEAIQYALEHLEFFQIDEFPIKLQTSLPIYPQGTLPANFNCPPSEVHGVSSFRLTGSHEAAMPILFPSAFNLSKKFRPDLENVFTVKVSENIRLTPESYERNVFHMELDISGKNISYDIGTALGVYPKNDYEKVSSFLAEHKFDGKQLIVIDRSDDFGAHSSEVVTLEQLLIKSLDVFGKPGKSFFQLLARHAKEDADKEIIASILKTSESLDDFLEFRTPSFADLLKFFPSVNLSAAELINALPPIKPRLYSISSSQHVHPNSIHLLVVLVDWTCKADGSHRFGQATKYLVNAKIGDEITVCLKPSVMKLPTSLENPVIMAGLGTGMAPFRAFIEERMYWKRKGYKVGPMALYFGSRNRANEYLYGEELEAYNSDGLLTYLRLAFSRDQPQKIYIQNCIQQDSEILHDLIVKKSGSFYLCGPTWPVPDVTDALLASFGISMSLDDSRLLLDDLKEQERFVLEVY